MTISPSGARIQGDDYQHLFSWYQALGLLLPGFGATTVTVEAKDAGFVDDVVVRGPGRTEYFQVKYSVDGQTPVTSSWWMARSGTQRRSPLEKFWSSWQELSSRGGRPLMTLLTNRPLDTRDPVLACISGRDGRLVPRLGERTPMSRAGRGRREWAEHLQISEQDLLSMLQEVRILAGQGPFSHLQETTSDRHRALGLSHDENALLAATGAARRWVADGKRDLDREAITQELSRLKLQAGPRQATLLVQEIDRDPWPDSPLVALDWVDLFEGEEARSRRRTADPDAWNDRMRPELIEAIATIHAQGYTDVMVRGALRLPSWFAVGAGLSDVAGFQVSCVQRGEVWSSNAVPSHVRVARRRKDIGQGPDLAVILSVTTEIDQDVERYIRQAQLPVRACLHLVPESGATDHALVDESAARGWALAARDAVREAVSATAVEKVHLFVAAPAGAALLLGHLWNRVPTTQLYADTNPGYVPAYVIPA